MSEGSPLKDSAAKVPTMGGAHIRWIDAPKTQQNKDILAYIKSLETESRLVAKAAFNPMKIPKYLPSLYLVEAIDGGRDFCLRLMGNWGVDILGENHTGKLFSEVDSLDVEWRCQMFRKVIEKASYMFCLTYVGDKDSVHKVMENLLVPLTDANGEIKYILNSFSQVPGRVDDYETGDY
ncbi:hypothetical protein GCM10017044_19480 [Kordiimonas sediminis]|uniref:Uncharacterized protein n=1 Tax=Kordiimonas sediminis TaxID=1735581 RepID=A0A919ATP3_9PROT|nr:PAS domain-containing protein [Kordiimonas sediminis]GHF24841.1 hypothetical protein GCM10017044_19480 [Kordiimonas sediminis]